MSSYEDISGSIKKGTDTNVTAFLLRQAEARTKLVVDCAGLLRRLEKLDAEIAEYDQWQRYPTQRYKSNVQIRFEESRRREAEEARRKGGDSWLSMASVQDTMPLAPRLPQAPAPSQRNVRPHSAAKTRPLPEEEESQTTSTAVSILQRALRAAEFEAEVWRERAHESAASSDREREQARRLMEFEISVALQEAEDERNRSALLIRQRDIAFEKVEEEFHALRDEHSKNIEALGESKRREVEQAMQVKRFVVAIAAEEAACKAAKSDLEAQRAYAASVKKELQQVRSQRDDAIRNVESCRANEATVAALETALATAKRDAEAAAAEKEKLRILSAKLETHITTLRSECDVNRRECDNKAEALAAAQLRVELLNAKSENLEAALENATRKQAQLTVERDAFKERANTLVGVQQRIDFEVDALRDSVDKLSSIDAKLGERHIGDDYFSKFATSTASTVVNSGVSSPRDSVASLSPQLPPVRPSSASRQSSKLRRELLALP